MNKKPQPETGDFQLSDKDLSSSDHPYGNNGWPVCKSALIGVVRAAIKKAKTGV